MLRPTLTPSPLSVATHSQQPRRPSGPALRHLALARTAVFGIHLTPLHYAQLTALALQLPLLMLLAPAGMAMATAVIKVVEMMEMGATEEDGENPKVRMDITASDQTALAQMVW